MKHSMRKAAKIFAVFSNNLDKYEYLTGEDLGLKPNPVEQAIFDYSPLGEIFNKGLCEDDKKKDFLRGQKIDAKLDTAELVCTKTDGIIYDFNRFAFPLKFIETIYNYEITLDEAKDDQDKLEKLIIRLRNQKARINKKGREK